MKPIKKLDKEKLEKAAYILKAIGHPARLAIVELLSQEERMSVNEICAHIGCEQSLTSHHLSNMRIKGLLTAKKEGKEVQYSLKQKELGKLLDCVADCECNM